MSQSTIKPSSPPELVNFNPLIIKSIISNSKVTDKDVSLSKEVQENVQQLINTLSTMIDLIENKHIIFEKIDDKNDKINLENAAAKFNDIVIIMNNKLESIEKLKALFRFVNTVAKEKKALANGKLINVDRSTQPSLGIDPNTGEEYNWLNYINNMKDDSNIINLLDFFKDIKLINSLDNTNNVPQEYIKTIIYFHLDYLNDCFKILRKVISTPMEYIGKPSSRRGFREKYLKYKQKYLMLKAQINF